MRMLNRDYYKKQTAIQIFIPKFVFNPIPATSGDFLAFLKEVSIAKLKIEAQAYVWSNIGLVYFNIVHHFLYP